MKVQRDSSPIRLHRSEHTHVSLLSLQLAYCLGLLWAPPPTVARNGSEKRGLHAAGELAQGAENSDGTEATDSANDSMEAGCSTGAVGDGLRTGIPSLSDEAARDGTADPRPGPARINGGGNDDEWEPYEFFQHMGGLSIQDPAQAGSTGESSTAATDRASAEAEAGPRFANSARAIRESRGLLIPGAPGVAGFADGFVEGWNTDGPPDEILDPLDTWNEGVADPRWDDPGEGSLESGLGFPPSPSPVASPLRLLRRPWAPDSPHLAEGSGAGGEVATDAGVAAAAQGRGAGESGNADGVSIDEIGLDLDCADDTLGVAPDGEAAGARGCAPVSPANSEGCFRAAADRPPSYPASSASSDTDSGGQGSAGKNIGVGGSEAAGQEPEEAGDGEDAKEESAPPAPPDDHLQDSCDEAEEVLQGRRR